LLNLRYIYKQSKWSVFAYGPDSQLLRIKLFDFTNIIVESKEEPNAYFTLISLGFREWSGFRSRLSFWGQFQAWA
jgi:hypothetical protein